MNELAIKLHEAAMVLENDGEFYREYNSDVNRSAEAFVRREVIARALLRNRLPPGVLLGCADEPGRDAREHLRRYLDDVWGMPPPAPPLPPDKAVKRWQELKFWEDSVKYPPVPAPQAETPPAGNGKPAQLPDDVELQNIDGVDWHVTRMPDGYISYSMATASRVWDGFAKQSGMGYRRNNGTWLTFGSPAFSGSHIYRWKPEFTFKLLEQEALEAEPVPPTSEVDSLTTNNIWKDHATDSLAYLTNLLNTQAKETIMNNTTKPAAIVITTKTLVNGVDIATMADSDIYDLISKQEAAVADLEKIDNKPKKLVNEIDKRKAGIQALVDYLDSKEPADDADSTAPADE